MIYVTYLFFFASDSNMYHFIGMYYFLIWIKGKCGAICYKPRYIWSFLMTCKCTISKTERNLFRSIKMVKIVVQSKAISYIHVRGIFFFICEMKMIKQLVSPTPPKWIKKILADKKYIGPNHLLPWWQIFVKT